MPRSNGQVSVARAAQVAVSRIRRYGASGGARPKTPLRTAATASCPGGKGAPAVALARVALGSRPTPCTLYRSGPRPTALLGRALPQNCRQARGRVAPVGAVRVVGVVRPNVARALLVGLGVATRLAAIVPSRSEALVSATGVVAAPARSLGIREAAIGDRAMVEVVSDG